MDLGCVRIEGETLYTMPMPIRNLMRAMNRATVLDTIRASGMISRIDIARTTGLSQALITGLTADLIHEGLIMEKKTGESEGGRKPILLALNPDGAFVVGVNLTITEISVVIANFEATVIASYALPLEPGYHSVEDIADGVVRAVQTCIWEANFSKEQISGVGLGIPGLVDFQTGQIRFLPNYGWENVDIRDLVRKQLNHPTFIDNSSNTLATAEQWFGMGKGCDHFLVVTIENGVGLGGVIHGRLYRGHNGFAGEFGHITINPDGPLCRCGKKGCVEAYAGNNSIIQKADRLAEQGLWTPADPHNLTYDQVLEGARQGNGALIDMFAEAGRMLGIGISHLVNLFNPARIILAGKGVNAGPLLFDAMNDMLAEHISGKFGSSGTEIVVQEWTDKDWAQAAGTLVLQELYKSPVTALEAAS